MNPGAKKKRATYQDLINAPANMIAELIDGELHLSNRPKTPAVTVATRLATTLGSKFSDDDGGDGGWIFNIEPELHLGDQVIVPDVAGWRTERLPVLPDGYVQIRPDWICEVLSPSTEKYDRTDKLRTYAAGGVPYAWLVHPRLRTLEALKLHDGHWLSLATHKDDDRARIAPFDELEIDLARLWARLSLPTRAGEESGEYQLSLP